MGVSLTQSRQLVLTFCRTLREGLACLFAKRCTRNQLPSTAICSRGSEQMCIIAALPPPVQSSNSGHMQPTDALTVVYSNHFVLGQEVALLPRWTARLGGSADLLASSFQDVDRHRQEAHFKYSPHQNALSHLGHASCNTLKRCQSRNSWHAT